MTSPVQATKVEAAVMRMRVEAILLLRTAQVTLDHFRMVAKLLLRVEVVGRGALKLESLALEAAKVSFAGVGVGVETIGFVGTVKNGGWWARCGGSWKCGVAGRCCGKGGSLIFLSGSGIKGCGYLLPSWQVNVPNVPVPLCPTVESPKHVESVKVRDVGRGSV